MESFTHIQTFHRGPNIKRKGECPLTVKLLPNRLMFYEQKSEPSYRSDRIHTSPEVALQACQGHCHDKTRKVNHSNKFGWNKNLLNILIKVTLSERDLQNFPPG